MMSKNGNKREYFIDGTMQYQQVGYAVHKDEIFPVYFADIVASRGVLLNDSFRIDTWKHSLLVVLPCELKFTEAENNRLKEYVSLWKRYIGDIEITPVYYGKSSDKIQDAQEGKSRFKQAKRAVMDTMRSLEKALLDEILDKLGDYDRVYIDGEFQDGKLNSEAEKKVISICKRFSLPSLEERLENGQNLIDETDRSILQLYRWKDQEDKGHWWTWFLKLRENPDLANDRLTSDMVQCTIKSEKEPDEETVRGWSDRLKELAFPTCYGLDRSRWRTHIYQIYLTELFSKQQRINILALEQIVYGK